MDNTYGAQRMFISLYLSELPTHLSHLPHFYRMIASPPLWSLNSPILQSLHQAMISACLVLSELYFTFAMQYIVNKVKY